ncbi:MAG: AAA family ATPase [Prevotellaceae bacterium]|nr:AAA family ATPase [Candidatus Minthosoma equi]
MSSTNQFYSSLDRPRSHKSEDLFEYCVLKAIDLGIAETPLTHLQWSSRLFSYEPNSEIRTDMMSAVKRDFSIYFGSELKYAFLMDKIEEHFPEMFGIVDEQLESMDDLALLFHDIQVALGREISEQSNPRNIDSYKVTALRSMPKRVNGNYIYRATLKMQDGNDPHFHEGLPFVYKTGTKRYPCETIDFDYDKGFLYFTSASLLSYSASAMVMLDAVFVLQGLMKRLQEIAASDCDENTPLFKIINEESTHLTNVEHGIVPPGLKARLDESQAKAFDAALNKDITFIWGPPGTGKSFTLASIIYALYVLGEGRTAVCCLSNVAVDQLVNKVVEVIKQEKRTVSAGELYRAGRTLDEQVLATNFLFPNDAETERIRRQIAENKVVLKELKEKGEDLSDRAIEIKAENQNLRDELRNHTEHLVQHSKVVFSTISNFVLSSSLNQGEFDNLIVDEASMLSMPSLIALASKVSKRIIMVGDFQQLSPIALVHDSLLIDSVFGICGIDMEHTKHPALHQLLNQRRSNKKIVDLINGAFYDNKLVAKIEDVNEIATKGPFPKGVIALKNVKDGAVRFTKGGTRQNKPHALHIIGLLDKYAKGEDDIFSIGIITPYKGQVSLISALIREREYTENFVKRIKVGTIHTFQGSECDVIIYDVVDCPLQEDKRKATIGKIYKGDEGERLLNVALSRARHKLIVVGDSDYIGNLPGKSTTYRTNKLFSNICRYRFVGE